MAKLQQNVTFLFHLVEILPPGESCSLPPPFMALIEYMWGKVIQVPATIAKSNNHCLTEHAFVQKLNIEYEI